MNKIKSAKGITLVSLVVTIIVLIIVAGISIYILLGENGIIERGKQAKEQTLVAQYKEKIELVKSEIRLEYHNGVTLEKLQDVFNSSSQSDWVNNTDIITDDDGIEKIKLTTNDTYIFYITENTTEYKGKNGEIIKNTAKITIVAIPENKTDIEVSKMTVDVKVSCTENITSSVGHYAWKNDLTDVSSSEWKTLTLNSNGDKERTAQITTTQATSGDYYLWIKIVVNGKEEIKKFGEYKFQTNPTQSNLICKITDKSEDSTTCTAELGSDRKFDGWTLSYTINDGTPITITAGTTTQVNNIKKGDLVIIKFSKENETDVTKTLNVDELKIAYTLKYDENGGTNAPADQVQYDNNSFTITEAEPTRDGKIFDGWYINAEGTGTKYSSGNSITITGTEMTLYAKWDSLNASMIEYNANWNGTTITTVEQALNYLYTKFNNN